MISQQKQRNGVGLRCAVCGHDRFYEREFALRSPTAAVFNHFWNVDRTTAYVCAKCGHMLLFAEAAAAAAERTPADKPISRVL